MVGYKILHDELVEYVREYKELLEQFSGSRFLISGAGGLIGSYLIYLIVEANEQLGLNIQVVAVDRDAKSLNRFAGVCEKYVTCYIRDVCIDAIPNGKYDYIVHAASNTSPVDYAQRPIDTIWTNVYGAKVLLDLAKQSKPKRFLYCSSVEAYGRNNGDVDKFDESYSGYVNSNTVRAGYPASKRCVEALCNAYAVEYNLDFVIARIGRFYGPTVISGDTKAPTQFISNAVRGENIILKSDGTQLFSWGYVGDCATALLTLLSKGESGGAYNVADPDSCSMLKEFAKQAADAGGGVSLSFVQKSQVDQAAYSNITKATMDMSKLEALGWHAMHHLSDGVARTVNYLRTLQEENSICQSQQF